MPYRTPPRPAPDGSCDHTWVLWIVWDNPSDWHEIVACERCSSIRAQSPWEWIKSIFIGFPRGTRTRSSMRNRHDHSTKMNSNPDA